MYSRHTNEVSNSSYDRMSALKAFDDRKTGVKGLVDEGAKQIPSIFVRPPEDRSNDLSTCPENITIPIIDLATINEGGDRSADIVQEILGASEKWGFFQVVNHGIPLEALDSMIEGARKFHEQDVESKKQFYTRQKSRQVTFNTNYDFYKSKAANWRDTLSINTLFTGALDRDDLPPVCRDAVLNYVDHIIKLGDLILELLSLGLGLERDYLRGLESNHGYNLAGHYYPTCPEPELTLGTSKHSDASFITMLLQDQMGGLQVLNEDQWVNVEPRVGALIVNIGDVLQIISNDKLKSVNHRVVARDVGPRISIAFFFKGLHSSPRIYRPIKELTSEENPPIYREFTLEEFNTYFFSRAVDQPGIEYFKLQSHQG